MRVLLALDGSASSDMARDLAASLAWPDATVMRLVSVLEPMAAALVGLAPYAAADDEADVAASLDGRLQDAVQFLTRPGCGVDKRLIRGRPASSIVDEAIDFRADLIVMGSRGLGPLRSMLLGSVSAEVVDHAPCPVLVARTASIAQVLVAVDGSDSSRRAVEHLRDSEYLRGRRLHVLTVDAVHGAHVPYLTMNVIEPASPTFEAPQTKGRESTEARAARAAEEMAADGYEVDWTVASGNPAHEIIEATTRFGCDLIVLGSRGLTGLDRIRLGSVARNVLLHSPASVLIVRESARQRQAEREQSRAGQPVGSSTG